MTGSKCIGATERDSDLSFLVVSKHGGIGLTFSTPASIFKPVKKSASPATHLQSMPVTRLKKFAADKAAETAQGNDTAPASVKKVVSAVHKAKNKPQLPAELIQTAPSMAPGMLLTCSKFWLFTDKILVKKPVKPIKNTRNNNKPQVWEKKSGALLQHLPIQDSLTRIFFSGCL